MKATEDELDDRFETINGVRMPIEDATEGHEQIVMNLASALKTGGDGGRRTYIRMPIRSDDASAKNELCPDVTVRYGAVGDRSFVIDPIVVIEVVSPTSRRRDGDLKHAIYLDFPTIRHVVMVDSMQMSVQHDMRTERGFERTLLSDPDDEIDLTALGFAMKLGGIYSGAVLDGPPPGVIEVYDCAPPGQDFVLRREEDESDEQYASRSEMIRTLFGRSG